MVNNSYFADNIKRFFSINYKLILSILFIIVIGLGIGIMCSVKSGEILDVNFIQGVFLKGFLVKKYSFFTYFLLKTLVLAGLLIVFYYLSFLKLGYVFIFLFGVYYGYLIGINICVILSIFSLLKGILIGIVAYGIFEIVILGLILLYTFKMLCYNRQKSVYGASILYGNEPKIILFFAGSLGIIVLIEAIFIAVIFKIFVF